MAKFRKVVVSTVVITSLLAISCIVFINLPIFARVNIEEPIAENSIATETLLDLFKPDKPKEKAYFVRSKINFFIEEEKIKKSELIVFYTKYTNSKTIAEVIYQYAIQYDVPVNVAFALAYGESRFDPKAYNKNVNGSTDRGLFQLNDRHRNWPIADYYDIEKNAKEGIGFLSYCLYLMKDNTVKALQAYNAGPTAALAGKIPETTKKHIEEILQFEDILNQDFNRSFVSNA
jgi:soluble lytic murein transglycosylase-like protein